MLVSASRTPRRRPGRKTGWSWLCLLAAVLTGSPVLAQSNPESEIPVVVISALRSRVLVSGLQPPEPAVLRIQDADSLIAALGDPYARLLSPPDYQQFRSSSGGAYGGIGARIATRQDTVWVTRVYPGSPAESSGLRPLDRVIAINERKTVGWSTGMAVEELRGPVGSTLTLLVLRGGGPEPISLMVRRGEVRIPSVQAAMADTTGIGIIHLAAFGDGAAAGVRQAIDSLVNAGMTGLILDLRGNPGGLLREALDIVRLFLEEGQLIAEVRGRANMVPTRFTSRTPDAYPHLPVVVLTGPMTASASEIVAGALQDHRRAGILGTRSYGKGSVQQVFQLPRRWRVKLTTARWYRPSGLAFDRLVLRTADSSTTVLPGGVTPDVLLADSMRLLSNRMVEGFESHWPRVSSALLREASQFLDTATTVTQNLVIPSTALRGLLDTLTNRDRVSPPSENLSEVRDWLAQRLAHLVVSVRWGQAVATHWRYRRDVQIIAASAFLHAARSPVGLVASMRWPAPNQVAHGTGSETVGSPMVRLLEMPAP